MRIYVASSWRNHPQPLVVATLREWGHEAYDFRNPPERAGFGWEAIHADWQKWTIEDFRDALAHPIAQAGYAADRRGMDWAELCVLVLPCGRSAHLEAGFMAGQGKPVLVLMLEPAEPELMYLLCGQTPIMASFSELATFLAGLERAREPGYPGWARWWF